jgi:hypothetical protein
MRFSLALLACGAVSAAAMHSFPSMEQIGTTAKEDPRPNNGLTPEGSRLLLMFLAQRTTSSTTTSTTASSLPRATLTAPRSRKSAGVWCGGGGAYLRPVLYPNDDRYYTDTAGGSCIGGSNAAALDDNSWLWKNFGPGPCPPCVNGTFKVADLLNARVAIPARDRLLAGTPAVLTLTSSLSTCASQGAAYAPMAPAVPILGPGSATPTAMTGLP